MNDPGIAQNFNNGVSSVKNSVNNAFSGFSNQPNAPSQFNFTNTIVAKFAFLIFVIIIFMFLFNLGINLIGYFSSPGDNPFVIKGQISGVNPLTISQDPKQNGSVTIMRSNNKEHGAEFTWSMWLYINDLPEESGKYQHIMNKGDKQYTPTNLARVNNAPGIYLGDVNNPDNQNNLHIVMDTVVPNDANNFVDIPNVPLRKWFHLALRLENTVLDVYVNGTITRRVVFDNVPKQNFNDIQLFQNGGFFGNLSDLRYFSSALNVFQINSVVNRGPDTSTSQLANSLTTLNGYHYLSQLWHKSK
jgi:hypothetical protein